MFSFVGTDTAVVRVAAFLPLVCEESNVDVIIAVVFEMPPCCLMAYTNIRSNKRNANQIQKPVYSIASRAKQPLTF